MGAVVDVMVLIFIWPCFLLKWGQIFDMENLMKEEQDMVLPRLKPTVVRMFGLV